MPYTHSHSVGPTRTTLTDVLDSGGDHRRRHDAERLTSVVAGVAAGVLTYVVVAQGPWAGGRVDQPPNPGPVAYPAGAPPAPTPDARNGAAALAPGPACRVPVRSPVTGVRLCFGTPDAASRWLADGREAEAG